MWIMSIVKWCYIIENFAGAPQNSNRNGGVRDSGGRTNNGRQPHVTPTVEDLDAELDAYVNDMKL